MIFPIVNTKVEKDLHISKSTVSKFNCLPYIQKAGEPVRQIVSALSSQTLNLDK